MEKVSYEISISAPPEKVFDIISGVEDFAKYSSLIKEIKRLNGKRFLWKIEVFGIPLTWEAEVTESKKPEIFRWRSVKGVYNAGSYSLKPSGKGTAVRFEMQYTIPIKIIEEITYPIISPIIKDVYAELLANIRKELEEKENP